VPSTPPNLTAVILAGGKGTRLLPHTAETPKPLVKVGQYPIIEILLKCLQRAGFTRVCIAVSHLSQVIVDALGDGSRFDLQIQYSQEETPLSTIGPLTLIEDLPEQFLVVNGDILTDMDFAALMEYHRGQQVPLTVATCQRESRNDFGVLEIGSTGMVTDFTEKPTFSFTVSAGVYVFSRDVLQYVPKGERFGFDQLMETLLENSVPVATYPYDGYWLDIGRHEDYQQANEDIDRIKGLID